MHWKLRKRETDSGPWSYSYSVLLASTGDSVTAFRWLFPPQSNLSGNACTGIPRGVSEVAPTKSQSIRATTEALQHLTGRVLITQASSALGCPCSPGRLMSLQNACPGYHEESLAMSWVPCLMRIRIPRHSRGPCC